MPAASNGVLRRLTVRSLLGLAIGLVVGITIQRLQPGWGTPVLTLVPAESPPAGLQPPSEGAAWVDDLVPSDLVSALGGSNILPAMLVTLAFALAARRLAPPALETLRRGFTAVGDAMFILVEWLLVLTPGVIAALVARTAATSGLEVGRVMLWFTAVEIIVLVAVVVALYPASILAGRTPPGRFARLLVPAQLTAATTRSSLATIPALLSASTSLARADSAMPYVIPLAGAVLKLSRAVSGPVKLIFLASVLGVPLTIDRILVFTVTIILLSPSTVGVPRVTSGSRSLPAYIAAGIPGEYVVLLSATTMVTDIFMTVLNTTGYFAAGVIVDRFVARGAVASRAEPATAT